MNVYETILFTTFKFAHGNCYMAMPPQYTNNTINYVLIYHKSLNLNAKPKQQKKTIKISLKTKNKKKMITNKRIHLKT